MITIRINFDCINLTRAGSKRSKKSKYHPKSLACQYSGRKSKGRNFL